MICEVALTDYALRAIGIGARVLPRTDFDLCQQFVLIGSGLIWNLYFALLALGLGFFLAVALALGKNSTRRRWRWPAASLVYFFRGSPLFIQFFFAYELFVLLPKVGFAFEIGSLVIDVETRWLTKAWLGALIVLFFNTACYAAEIFYGALRAIPRGDLEAADAIGLVGFKRFRRIVWPTMLRLAWPAYTNEAIFLFHATALVFFSSFPAWRQKGDALYYASYFAEKTFNPFVAYPIIALYFMVFTGVIILLFGVVNRRLNRHM